MNIFMKSELKQTATYWGPIVNDGYASGSFPAPVEILCRWEDKQEKYVTREGEQRISNAVVMPDRALEVGGWLYEGASSAVDPRQVDGSFRIMRLEKHPSLDATEMQVIVWL